MGRIAIALCALLVGATAHAQQQTPCAPREVILLELEKQYAELPSLQAIADNGCVLELLTSENGETWTLICSLPNGTSCFVISGHHLRQVERRQRDTPL